MLTRCLASSNKDVALAAAGATLKAGTEKQTRLRLIRIQSLAWGTFDMGGGGV